MKRLVIIIIRAHSASDLSEVASLCAEKVTLVGVLCAQEASSPTSTLLAALVILGCERGSGTSVTIQSQLPMRCWMQRCKAEGLMQTN